MNKDKKKAILYAQNKKDFELFLSKMRKTKSRDLAHLTRKISPFIKTSRLGNYLTLRFKYSSNSILLIPNFDPDFNKLMSFIIKCSKHQSIDFELIVYVSTFSELLRKITYRHNLFFNEDN
ncbi:hypothetical protein [Flavobacterium sp. HNIBRBA15423]|uniref:hypothetical protein n=1 Tax=Flavobacterium sp. HNIBRBA15423 TaxID=3458683 RepID=UPI004044F3EF